MKIFLLWNKNQRFICIVTKDEFPNGPIRLKVIELSFKDKEIQNNNKRQAKWPNETFDYHKKDEKCPPPKKTNYKKN